ncbi:hypothetical protein ABPG72_018901 [Tetrahymena utriculariae]
MNVQNMSLIKIKNNKILDQNKFFQNTQGIEQLRIQYGIENKTIFLNKTYLCEQFICKIPYDQLDLSIYGQNILSTDFENFINFLLYGELQFYSLQIPTYICLFAVFQMHINLKDIIYQILESFNQGQCQLHHTQNQDDILLYHLFEMYTQNKTSYSGFMMLMLNQQWLMIQQGISWFSYQNGQNLEISPLLKWFNEDQFGSFLKSLYFYERIYFFNSEKCKPDCASDALYVIIGFNKIINQYYNNQKTIDPIQRTQQVYTILNQYLPLDKNINMGFFKEIKDFYDPKLVNEILISQVEKLQKQVEELNEQKLAYIFTSKISLWQLQNHQQ